MPLHHLQLRPNSHFSRTVCCWSHRHFFLTATTSWFLPGVFFRWIANRQISLSSIWRCDSCLWNANTDVPHWVRLFPAAKAGVVSVWCDLTEFTCASMLLAHTSWLVIPGGCSWLSHLEVTQLSFGLFSVTCTLPPRLLLPLHRCWMSRAAKLPRKHQS